MATGVFKYKDAAHSSQLPTIIIPEGPIIIGGQPAHRSVTEMSRSAFWENVISGAAAVVAVAASETPVYIATGGGYGSNDLIGFGKKEGLIAPAIPSINGNMFRTLPAFVAEADLVKEAIRKHIGPEATDQEVQQIYAAFYSDEANTCLAKEVVKAIIRQQKSCIHESASLYPDTVERAELAKQCGVKTMLLAGDRDIDLALRGQGIEPANTVRSYKVFAERFEGELVPLFNVVNLYNTNNPLSPVLIAHKASAGQPLKILDKDLYAEFIAKQYLDPYDYQSRVASADVIANDWEKRQPGADRPSDPVPGSKPAEPGGQK